MKKSLTIISTAILALTLAACSDNQSASKPTTAKVEILNSVNYNDKSLHKVDFEQRTDRKTYSSTVIKRGDFTFNINLKSIPSEEALLKSGAELVKVTKHEDAGKTDYNINVEISQDMPLKAVITNQKLILHPLSVKENISKADAQALVDAFSQYYQAYHDAYVTVEKGEENAEKGLTELEIKEAYDKVPFQDLNFPYNYENENHFYVYEFNTSNEKQYIREVFMKNPSSGYELVLVSDGYNPEQGRKVSVQRSDDGKIIIHVQMLEPLSREQSDAMIEELKNLHLEALKTTIYSPDNIVAIVDKYKAVPFVVQQAQEEAAKNSPDTQVEPSQTNLEEKAEVKAEEAK